MVQRKKKAQPAEEQQATRPAVQTVGDVLREARIARKMEYEDVSVAIHIRPGQLRAIEENDIESLPGMTYAIGFVRSYANFLGLNGAEVVHRFKAEHGQGAPSSKLVFPEPVAENRGPDPMMIGVGAFLAVVILVGWTVYTNISSGRDVAEQIPAAPTEAVAEAPAAVDTALTPAPEAAMSTTAGASEVPAGSEAAMSTPPVAVPATVADPAPIAAAPAPEAAAPAKVETPAPAVAEAAPPKAEKPAAAETDKKNEEGVINIKKGKSRITLKATQASWIQVTDAQQNVIYRKVLRPGESYTVPDQPGLILDTANAGGLGVVVDGKDVQSIGKPGEIVRGTALDPGALKAQRIRVRN